MGPEEQRRVRAENMILLEDKRAELQCCYLKAHTMGTCWNVLGQVLSGRMQGYVPEQEEAAYPSQTEVKALRKDVLRLTEEIATLERLLRPSQHG
jgi:hypothetical protein